ncbi:MAG: metalloregulator ArsR/SmtB family transcription factor [Acidobacteriota bacterium]
MSNVFTAIAEPTRRQLLERLRTRGPLSLSQLAEPLPISRQAVTKHLDVLRRCGLIRIQRSGRLRLHALQPEPLRDVESWLKPYAEEWDRRLMRLKKHLEEKT